MQPAPRMRRLRLPTDFAASALQRPLSIRRYLARMSERGIAPAKVLRGTGIDAGQLEDPACMVEAVQTQAVIANMIRLTGDPGLGFAFGHGARIADLGIVGHAVMSARSLRHATALWNQFCVSLLGSLVRPTVVDRGRGRWAIRLETDLPTGLVRLFCLEEILMMGLGLLQPLLDRPPQIERILLSYPAPPHARRYHEAIDFPLRFDARATEIRFTAPALDAPLAANDAEMNEICRRHCQQIMRRAGTTSALIARLRKLFLRNAGALPSLDEAAQALDMSARTLRRRLQEQGTHYQALRKDFCLDLARAYLDSHQLAPKEVGYLLGFQFPTTFRRAFKSWTGQTVRQYCRDDGHSVISH